MEPEAFPILKPKGAQLLRFLAGEIAAGRIKKGEPETFVTYAEVLRGMGVVKIYHAGQQLNRNGLMDLNLWTQSDPGIPKIAALIVNQDTKRPSEAFLKSHHRQSNDWAWWLAEAAKAIDFDWLPFLGASAEEPAARVREGQDNLPDHRGVVTLEPGPAHIRETKITVAEILRRLAVGQTEAEIIRTHAGLRTADIRASLAYAAEREKSSGPAEKGPSRLALIASRWEKRLALPKTDPADRRRDYLLRKYWRARE